MWNRIKNFSVAALLVAGLFGCSGEKHTEEKIKVATISGPETELMVVAKTYAKNKYNLDIEIVEFQDYAITNVAVADGSVDANATQTIQFFEEWKKAQGNNRLIAVANTFIYPMGLYSHKIHAIKELQKGAKVAVPNDPSNEARALLLLEKAGLVTLQPTEAAYTVNDIVDNPLGLNIVTLAPAQLPRALVDVDLAAINTNYALPAGLSPTEHAIFVEGNDSPYANIIVTRVELQNDPRIVRLVEAYHSPQVTAKAEELFKGHALPAWKENTTVQQ